jgi:hypothetical protein
LFFLKFLAGKNYLKILKLLVFLGLIIIIKLDNNMNPESFENLNSGGERNEEEKKEKRKRKERRKRTDEAKEEAKLTLRYAELTQKYFGTKRDILTPEMINKIQEKLVKPIREKERRNLSLGKNVKK